MSDCLQEQYALKSHCFGCGPSNAHGLRVRSFMRGRQLEAEWVGKSQHEAFDGVVAGGIVASILDCHANWGAAMFLHGQESVPPCTVTASFTLTLYAPTPSGQLLRLFARPIELKGRRAVMEAELFVEQMLCAKLQGEFVQVKEGHPAFHRW